MSAHNSILKEWAKKWSEENLSTDILTLINQASFDLHNGPGGDPATNDEELVKYPGFITATRTIRQALQDLPSDLYIDTESDTVLDSPPQDEKCEGCNGQGRKTEENFSCTDCGGRGCFDSPGDWWHVERHDILKAIVGGELLEYIQ
jgi:hypothetical protein